MKGSIFKLFEAYVTESFGPDAFDDLLDETELETVEPFVGPGTYPPGDLVALLGTTSATYDASIEDLLRGFGRFAFPALASAVPTLMEGFTDPRTFLVGLETVIHTEVRKLYPDAHPAQFTTVEVGPNEVDLHYKSALGLFPMVEGLLEGLGDWYGWSVEHRQISTEGTNAVYRVIVAPPEQTVESLASAAASAPGPGVR